MRAYYRPDILTDDWPIYFIPFEKDDGEYVWAMKDHREFQYPFYVPFFDKDWIIFYGN